MKKIFGLGILIFIVFISCKTDKHKESSISKQNEILIKKVIIDSTPKKKIIKSLKIPFISEYNLTKMKLDSSKIYGAGDCSGNIHMFSLSDFNITIDSLFCGDYGFKNTKYIYSDKKIQTVHQIISEYDNGTDYIFTEVVYDLRDSIAHIIKRIDTVGYNIKKSDKKFNKITSRKRDSIAKYWVESNNETWRLKFDKEP